MDNFEMSSSVLELSEHKTYLELTRRSCYYNYPNGNHVQLNSDNAEEMAETLVNQPVVAKYKKIAGKDDLRGHECSVDKDGNVICFLNDYMDENGLFTKKYPLPQTVEEYLRNIEIQKEIVNKRNKRIKDFVCSEVHPGA